MSDNTSKSVLDLLKTLYLKFKKIAVKRELRSSFKCTTETATILF